MLRALLEEYGFDGVGFEAYLSGVGRARHDIVQAEAEAAGVFGVPSYLIQGELFWGLERLQRVKEILMS